MNDDTSDLATSPSDFPLDIDDIDIAEIIDRVIECSTPGDVLQVLDSAFGGDASFFIVDHDFEQLRFLTDDHATPLDSSLSQAFAEAEPTTTDDGWWLPIPERTSVTFGVHFADTPPVAQQAALVQRSRRLGVCTATLLTHFEDFEQRRRSHDMSVAAELQWSLLPPNAGTAGGFNYASALEPAYEVAGDLFDYSYFDGALWIYSLDAMGHGIEATMSGVVALTALRKSRREGASLTEQMTAANAVVHDQWHGERFVTAVGCRLTHDDIEIANAGHEPLRRRQGDKISMLSITPSLPLGVTPSTIYRTEREPALDRDHSLILLSDGSAEARDKDGTVFGAPAVDTALEASWSDAPLRAAHSYLSRVAAFLDGGRPNDDITVVIVSTDQGEQT